MRDSLPFIAAVSVVILLADGARPDTLVGRARLRCAAGARAPARGRRPAHGHVVLSVGHRTGLRAISPGPLPRTGRPARAALVRPRAHGVQLSRLLAELRRLSDECGERRSRRLRADDLRAHRHESRRAQRDHARAAGPPTHRVDHARSRRFAAHALTSPATSPAGSRSIASPRVSSCGVFGWSSRISCSPH